MAELSLTGRIWSLPRADPAADRLAAALGVHPLVAAVLWARGFNQPECARAFLEPSLRDLHDPFLLAGMDAAVARLLRAFQAGERIVIYGDYDVDGLCAVVILLRLFRLLGANVRHYIPQRLREGYGLNLAAVEEIRQEGADLVVTVDCGISAPQEVARLRQAGIDVIITDHHHPPPTLPEALVLLSPHLPQGHYPFAELCGAALAYKLAWAVAQKVSGGKRVRPKLRAFLLETLPLAMLGTVADVAPLLGENRALVRDGLSGLGRNVLPGIDALLAVCGLRPEAVRARDVAFRLAPRLNAAGRTGQQDLALELLLTEDRSRARQLAARLDSLNQERQRLERKILGEARALAAERAPQARTLVFAKEGWHVGVVGIVASRLAEEFYRPTVLVALDGEEGRGSGRSAGSLHLTRALEDCAPLLEDYGGHAGAAGIRIRRQNVEGFAAAFEAAARQRLAEEALIPRLPIDAPASLPQLNEAVVAELSALAPYGHGNPEPLLVARNVEVNSALRALGASGSHLSFFMRENDHCLRCVAFGWGDRAAELTRLFATRRLDIAFRPELNEFRGDRTLQANVEDIRVSDGTR